MDVSGEVPIAPISDCKNWFVGGRSDNFANFEGKVAKLSLFDRALTPAEVKQHYLTSGIAETASPRVTQ